MNHRFAHSLLILASLLLLNQRASAQDQQYSQFYSNLLMLNPAFAGSAQGPRISMNARNQWVGIPGNYKQGAFSYDQPFFLGNTTHGYGLNLTFDRAGEGNLTKTELFANYAFQFEVQDEHIIRLGVQGGLQMASIDFFALRFPDQIDPRDGVVRPTIEPGLGGGLNPSQTRPDFGTGIAYFNKYAYFGFTANHLTEPLQRFYTGAPAPGLPPDINARLPRKYTFTGGVKLPVGPYNRHNPVTLTPAFLYKIQGEFSQLDLGMYLDIDPISLGLWYRNQDALIFLVGLHKDNFRFGYSFDYTISTLTQPVSGGSHEVSFVLEFEQYRKSRFKHKQLPCPHF